MDTKDSLVVEILARLSKNADYKKLAPSDDLLVEVSRCYQEAEETLREKSSVDCVLQDPDNKNPWGLVYYGESLYVIPRGGSPLRHWTGVPQSILVEALTLVPKLLLSATKHSTAMQADILQNSAAFNGANKEEALPLLKGQQIAPPEPVEEEAPVLDPNEGFEDKADNSDTEEVLETLLAADEIDTQPSPESVLADEILAGLEVKALDFEAPLPELTKAPKLPKSRKVKTKV